MRKTAARAGGRRPLAEFAPWPDPFPAAFDFFASPRSSRALIIGVSVNDTSRLTITATAAVMPN